MNYHIHKYSRHDRRSPAVAVGEKVRAEKAVLAFIKTFSVLISRHFVGIYIEGGVRRDWSRCSPGEGTGRIGVRGLALPPSHSSPPRSDLRGPLSSSCVSSGLARVRLVGSEWTVVHPWDGVCLAGPGTARWSPCWVSSSHCYHARPGQRKYWTLLSWYDFLSN